MGVIWEQKTDTLGPGKCWKKSKSICKGKGEVARRLVGEEKGSGAISVMCNIQEPERKMTVCAVCDGMVHLVREKSKGPDQP